LGDALRSGEQQLMCMPDESSPPLDQQVQLYLLFALHRQPVPYTHHAITLDNYCKRLGRVL